MKTLINILSLLIFSLLTQCKEFVVEPPMAAFEVEHAYFGYRFEASAPNNPVIFMVMVDEDIDCDALDTATETVSLALSGTDSGAYTLSAEEFHQNVPDAFAANGSHSYDEFKYRFAAGSFDLTSFTLDNNGQPSRMRGELDVYAPLHPLRTVECSASNDAGLCVCEHEDGSRLECRPEKRGEDCCPYQTEDHWVLNFSVEADFCPLLCHASTVDLYNEACSYGP